MAMRMSRPVLIAALRTIEFKAAVALMPHSVHALWGDRIKRTMQAYVADYFGALDRAVRSGAAMTIVKREATKTRDGAEWTESREREVERRVAAVIGKEAEAKSRRLREALFGPMVLGWYTAALKVKIPRFAKSKLDPDDPRVINWISAQSMPPRKVADWAEKHAARDVKGMNDASKDRIAGIISGGLRNGQEQGQIADAIQEAFTGMSRDRAELIALQETQEGLNRGAHDKAKKDGAEQHQWLTMGVAKNCVEGQPCYVNEDQGWIPFGEPYQSGHVRPPAHIGCYCTEVYRGGEAIDIDEVPDDGITPLILDEALKSIFGYLTDITYKNGIWLPGEELAA